MSFEVKNQLRQKRANWLCPSTVAGAKAFKFWLRIHYWPAPGSKMGEEGEITQHGRIVSTLRTFFFAGWRGRVKSYKGGSHISKGNKLLISVEYGSK